MLKKLTLAPNIPLGIYVHTGLEHTRQDVIILDQHLEVNWETLSHLNKNNRYLCSGNYISNDHCD